MDEWLRYFLGAGLCSCNQPVQALLCHQQGLAAIADGAIRNSELLMLVYKGLGNAYLILGAYAEATAYFLLAREQGKDVYAPCAQGLIEWGLGLVYTLQGHLLQAKDALVRALHLFERLDARPLMAEVWPLLGQVLMHLRRDDEARMVLRRAVEAAERIGDPATRGIVLGSVALLHLAQEHPAKAISAILEGLAALQELRDQQIAGQLYLVLARAYELQRDPDVAEEAFKTALALLYDTQHRGLIIRAHECYGQFLADQRRFQEAYEQVQAASRTASYLYSAGAVGSAW